MTEPRHAATVHLLSQFSYAHLRTDHLQTLSKQFHDLAFDLAGQLHDGPELTAGLRKLLEAKDCCIRQSIIDSTIPRE